MAGSEVVREKLVQGLLLVQGERVDLAVHWLEVQRQFDGMIPGSSRWHLIELVLAENFRVHLEVMFQIRDVHSGFLLSSMLHAAQTPRVLRVLPVPCNVDGEQSIPLFQGDVRCVVHVDRFFLRRQVPTRRRAAIEGARVFLPVDRRVVSFEPVVSQVQCRPMQIQDTEFDVFNILSNVESNLGKFHDSPCTSDGYFIWSCFYLILLN